MATQENVTSQNSQSPTASRGQDLKAQMIDSEKRGEEFRKENQGKDIVEGQNNPETKNPSPEESGE